MALAHGGGFGSNPYGGPRALPNVGGPGNQLYVGNVRHFYVVLQNSLVSVTFNLILTPVLSVLS